jgi:hypothetical protein
MNGSEDARDHLWLAQDLWMQDAPWNWVSRDPFVQARVLRECSNVQCKKREERVGQWQKCAGCKQVSGLVDIVLGGVSRANNLYSNGTARAFVKSRIGRTTRRRAKRHSVAKKACGCGSSSVRTVKQHVPIRNAPYSGFRFPPFPPFGSI